MPISRRRRNGAPDTHALGPVIGFMRVVWELDHELTKVSKAMRARLGVTGPQRLAILVVGRYPGVSAGELAAVLHLHPSTLTGILRRLVRNRLVERVADAADARRALFRLTARGRRVDAARTDTVEARVRRAVSLLAGKDLAIAERVLRTVIGELAR